MNQTILAGHYDWGLVLLSIVIAVCASYTALDLAGRTTMSRGRNRLYWLSAGSMAMGLGIWAMHYIGMLAYRLPVEVFYSLPTVAISLFAAIAASAVALVVVSRPELDKFGLAGGSLIMGLGIASMHYCGMAAMHLAAHQVYNASVVALSVLIAIAVSGVALCLAFRLRDRDKNRTWHRPLSALVMGLAIASMHYTGMAAVCFHSATSTGAGGSFVPVTSLGISGIAAVTFGVLAISLVGSLADRNFSSQRQMLESEQERWRLLISANRDGIFDADLLTGKTFYSPQWMAMLGYDADDLPATNQIWNQLIHPDDKQWVEKNLEEYLLGPQGTSELEYRLIHKDGSPRWILARAQAVWDSEGRPIRIVGSHSDVTERKQAEEKLKASEARFSTFMQHNPCSAFIKDSDGRLVYVNAVLERLWNLRPGEWTGKLDHEIWPAELAERFRKKDQEIRESPSPIEEVETLRTPDGILRQFLLTKFSFPESKDRKAIGGFAIEITDRVQTEERLRASESRYRELFERNPLPSWIYCFDDLRIVDVNQAAIEHYGWPAEKFVGLHLSSIRMPGESDAVEAQLRECSTGGRRTKPLRHRRNGQSLIWVELSTQELDFGGRSARLIMANDVTAHIEMEDAIKRAHDQLEDLVAQRTSQLESSKAKWHRLVEALPQCVWTTTPDGLCDYMSRQWTDFTGVSQSELLGLGWLNTLHPEDKARVQELRMAAREKSDSYDVEYRVRSKNGSYRWFVASGRPLSNLPEGPISQWLGTSTDIDDQKRKKESLETAVAERTAALAEALERAECATRAKSEFLATMSHEIRTPLNGVIGMTHLMKDTPLTPQQKFFLETIESSGQALLAIINDILDFSKIEAGKILLDTAEFDLRKLLQESINVVTPSALTKDLQISIKVEEKIPAKAVGDAQRICQILLNLLSNAVKFTERGSVSLTVSLEAQKQEVMTLRFAVRDTGIGLSLEQQSNLFHAFTQADLSTTRRFGGTGLGLTIAKRLVELMGGTIGVASTLGEGATFWFQVSLDASSRGHYSTGQTSATFDLALLTKRLKGNQKLVGVLLDSFSSEMPLQIQALINSLEVGSAKDVQELAQKIKRAASGVGGNALREVAYTIELAAEAGDLAAASGCLMDLNVSFIRLKEAITTRSADHQSELNHPDLKLS